MTDSRPGEAIPDRRARIAPGAYTSATLTGGVIAAAVCFAIALLAELAGFALGDGAMTDLGAIVGGLLSLQPWAWAAVGAYVIVATPIVALLVTAAEYRSVGDRRAVLLAVAVLAVLGLSAVVAILR
jgi:uncharacterized membrane protein